MAAELEDAFGGGGYTALQRAALLQLAWDQVSSGLDGREAAFELHASGGLEAWRAQVAAWFPAYNELANGVQEFVNVELPHLDLSSLHEIAPPPRRMPLSDAQEAELPWSNSLPVRISPPPSGGGLEPALSLPKGWG